MEDNPYLVSAELESFDLRSSVFVSFQFVCVGAIFAAVGGYAVERLLQTSSGMRMATPGLVFGLGVVVAACLFVPAARKPAVVLLPVICLLGFITIGVMYDTVRNSVVACGTSGAGLLQGWALLALASLPGVVVMAFGCRLIARPRSLVRFAMFVVVTSGLAGLSPMLTSIRPGPLADLPVFFLTMFVSQLLMFAMLGWILGDSEPIEP